MRTFTRDSKNATIFRSDDGVIVCTYFNRDLMSYESEGNVWVIPFEFGGDHIYSIYAGRDAIYSKKAGFNKVDGDRVRIDERLLLQIREDLLQVFQANGIPSARIKFE